MATDPERQTGLGGLLARAAGGGETTVLGGRTLVTVRAVVLAVFAAATVLYAIDLFALWDETHLREFEAQASDHDGTDRHNYFGLTWQERLLLGVSITETPGWYPVFVITRQVVLDVVALGIAWLIFSRRPRHWMAYLATLFILLAPWLAHLMNNPTRHDGLVMRVLSVSLGVIAMLTMGAFLWLFPDGRFRRPLVRLLGGICGLTVATLAVIAALFAFGVPRGVAEGVFISAFFVVLLGALFWAGAGIVVQIWRYRHTPLSNRRLARWNLAFLVAIPLWIMPSRIFHDFFGEEDENRDDMFGFVWEQIHETLYLAAPVLLGIWVLFLVRRQGWWDFQTLWNRTAVYGIGVVLLGGLYLAALGLVTVVASPLAATGEQVVAVIVATAIVAFSYGPLLGRVRAWVDERWFPKRAEVDAVSMAFADELRVTASPESVPDHLRTAVQESLDPEHVELWTIGGGVER